MPDAAIFIRPDVTLNDALATSHARVHNFTNAVLALTDATDLGVVDVRVGQGQNVAVVLGTETTAVGAGHAVTLRAGDAVGGGPSAGGSITIQPGVGVGGGARGRVLPDTDNVVSLGSLTRAFFEIVVNTVGSLNQPLNLVATRTTDGVGQHVIISGGPAIGAGPSAGGNVQIVPGNGVGGGARGFIHLDDAGSALNILPTTTNLVTVGSASLALAAVRTRIVQADANNFLNINRQDGATWAQLDNAGGVARVTINTQFQDQISSVFGSAGDDAEIRWNTNSANNLLIISTSVNSAARSGNVILTAFANRSNEHGLAAVLTPRFAIFSAADMSVAGNRTQYIQMYHDGTDAQILAGNSATGGLIRLNGGATAASGAVTNEVVRIANGSLLLRADSNTTFCTVVGDNVNVSGLRWAVGSGLGAAGTFVVGTTSNTPVNVITNSVARMVITHAVGAAFITCTQPASTSGSPTGLLWTAGTHTTLTAAETVDQNWNNARTVTFTTGAAIPLQRVVRFQSPTYAGSAPTQTLDEVAIVDIDAPAAAGANASITLAASLRVGGDILPAATNTVNVGGATRALASVRTRSMQADTGQALVIRRQDGSAWATTDTGTSSTVVGSIQTNFSGTLLMLDNITNSFGTGSDVQKRWSTVQANNAMMMATGVNSAATSGNWIFTTVANIANEHGLAAVATPRLAIFSAADMSVAGNRTQYVQMYHDGSSGYFITGTGTILIRPGGFTLYTLNSGVGSAVAHSLAQNASTSGTPTGILFTAGAHTALANAETIDQNWNNARTVQFTGNTTLATQRSCVIQAPTYASDTATKLLTTAVSVAITATPAAGTNVEIRNPIALQVGGTVSVGATAATFSYRAIDIPAHTVTVTGATQVTATVGVAALRLDIVTLSDASAVTVDHAATLHIVGVPVGGGAGPVTITTAWAIRCDAGSIGAGAGSTSRPAFSFSGDPDTGLYSVAANTIGVATAGDAVPRLQIDANENADETALLVSVAGAAVIRVSVGAVDSGGAGFRLLRVPNA